MTAVPSVQRLRARRRLGDRLGDGLLHLLTAAAALAAVTLVTGIAYKVFDGAAPAISHFGLGFLKEMSWNPVKDVYGAAPLLFGTVVTSLLALLVATPLAIAIGLYLSELAPRGARGALATLVELLAAIPSVVLGLWGILVLGPFMKDHLEPWLQGTFGFLPIFGGRPYASGVLTASLVLAIMIVPIVASISRELFLSVPRELEEGALALGATRWEMVRGVVLASARPGIAAAVILGFGRAIGEAIAVGLTIGGATAINSSLFAPGDTLASRIAGQFQGASTNLQVSSLFYLAALLLVIGLVANVLAQVVVRRFEYQRTGAG